MGCHISDDLDDSYVCSPVFGCGVKMDRRELNKLTRMGKKYVNGLPKGHPFIDREYPGALKGKEDSIEKPEDPIKNMTEEEMKEYFNR